MYLIKFISGHSYLDKKWLVKVQFGSSKCTFPLRLFGSHPLSSLKLVLSSMPESSVPYNVSIPMKDIQEFTFMTLDVSTFSLQFDIYPTYGTKSIGKAVVLSSCLIQLLESNWNGLGDYEVFHCPVFDSHLRVIGEVSFELCLVKPFTHSSLQIGGDVETYWKSTTVSFLNFLRIFNFLKNRFFKNPKQPMIHLPL